MVFTGALAAVRAAATLQRLLRETTWPAGLVLRVRAALHAGDIKQRGNDYEGIAINRTARLRSTAHGGQVVVSRALVELTGADLIDGIRFESLGRHRVRDLPGWTEIFQLCGPSMDRDFPSLVTLDTGLPPVTTIVYLDAIGPIRTTRTWSPGEIRDALGNLVDVFAATTFSSSGGQYLKQLGDGCIALFADPDVALSFARAARIAASRHEISLRCAVHVGRVEFIHEEPVGTLLLATGELVRRAPPDRIALSSTAGARTQSRCGPRHPRLTSAADKPGGSITHVCAVLRFPAVVTRRTFSARVMCSDRERRTADIYLIWRLAPSQYGARSSRLSSLPDGLRGSTSAKSTDFGSL